MSARPCTVPDCDQPHRAKGYCNPHYLKWRTHGTPTPTNAPRPAADIIEDVEWMVETGEVWENAWRRLGYTNDRALERVLDRAGRSDLVSALKRSRAWVA